MNNQVWIMGRVHPSPEDKDLDLCKDWEFMGVFTDEEQASKACTELHDFIAPATLNVKLPDERTAWPGAYNPLFRG
jgi:hypothetical protein